MSFASWLALALIGAVGLWFAWRYVRLARAVRALQSADLSDAGEIRATAAELAGLARAVRLIVADNARQLSELESERDRLAAVLNQLTDGVLIADAAGEVQYANPASAQLFGVADPVGRTVTEVQRNHNLVEAWELSRQGASLHAAVVELPARRQFLQLIAMPDRHAGGSLRYRDLGSLCAQSMDAAIRLTRPGMTEPELSGLLARQASARGVQPIVNLIATDERIYRYRHPLPTDKRMERYAMLVICGRKWGLVCSLTRLVHFGALPGELQRKSGAAATIDAQLIAATRPGKSLGDIFKEGIDAYEAAGFADEWKLHHQGGLAGYNPRELVATPTTTFPVSASQAYAWNPSITGTKSEDTILVGDDGNEIITAIAGWPVIEVKVDGRIIQRPAILEQQ